MPPRFRPRHWNHDLNSEFVCEMRQHPPLISFDLRNQNVRRLDPLKKRLVDTIDFGGAGKLLPGRTMLEGVLFRLDIREDPSRITVQLACVAQRFDVANKMVLQ